MIERLSFVPSLRNRTIPLVLAALGAMAVAYGLYSSSKQAWACLLLNGFYFMSLSVSAILFLATQRLSGARWSASLRRIPEAFTTAMPVASVLMLVVYFGRHQLFPWTDPKAFADALAIAGKARYFRGPFPIYRMVVSLASWCIFAWLFRKASLDQDRNPGSNIEYHNRLNRFSAVFVLVFAISFTLASFDWILGLDPSWFSTMFAIYVFIGTFVEGLAAVTLAAVLLSERGIFRDWITKNQFHDLGEMLFAFTTFWAYIWTCQYLLIWYANIPEETSHYLTRTNGPWLSLFAVNFLVNWVLPFTVLMSANAKRQARVLKFVAVALLLGHYLDLYLLIMPSFWPTPRFGVMEVCITLGYGGLFYFWFIRGLARASLVPVNDPILAANILRKQTAQAHG